MKVKLLKAWRAWGKGHVFTDMPEGQASELIRRGIAAEETKVEINAKRPRAGMRAGRDYVTR